jgi:hypothetical protein
MIANDPALTAIARDFPVRRSRYDNDDLNF